VNRAELIDAIRNRLGVEKRTAENAVDAVLDTIQRAVAQGEKVAITGFGVFEKVDRAARTGRNPRTGEAVKVKKTSVPKFRPGSQFKGVVSGAVRLGKVADAATKAAAKSTATTARSSARTAASGPSKAAKAARSAAKKAGGTTTKRASGAKATTRSTAKKSTSKAASTKKSTAKRTAAKKTARR
jgi:DNA-binding protein HU-beta